MLSTHSVSHHHASAALRLLQGSCCAFPLVVSDTTETHSACCVWCHADLLAGAKSEICKGCNDSWRCCWCACSLSETWGTGNGPAGRATLCGPCGQRYRKFDLAHGPMPVKKWWSCAWCDRTQEQDSKASEVGSGLTVGATRTRCTGPDGAGSDQSSFSCLYCATISSCVVLPYTFV